MNIFALMVLFFILCMMIFAAVAFFLPEWLGITGKKARDIMQHQAPELDKEDIPQPQKE